MKFSTLFVAAFSIATACASVLPLNARTDVPAETRAVPVGGIADVQSTITGLKSTIDKELADISTHTFGSN